MLLLENNTFHVVIMLWLSLLRVILQKANNVLLTYDWIHLGGQNEKSFYAKSCLDYPQKIPYSHVVYYFFNKLCFIKRPSNKLHLIYFASFATAVCFSVLLNM